MSADFFPVGRNAATVGCTRCGAIVVDTEASRAAHEAFHGRVPGEPVGEWDLVDDEAGVFVGDTWQFGEYDWRVTRRIGDRVGMRATEVPQIATNVAVGVLTAKGRLVARGDVQPHDKPADEEVPEPEPEPTEGSTWRWGDQDWLVVFIDTDNEFVDVAHVAPIDDPADAGDVFVPVRELQRNGKCIDNGPDFEDQTGPGPYRGEAWRFDNENWLITGAGPFADPQSGRLRIRATRCASHTATPEMVSVDLSIEQLTREGRRLQ